MKLYQLRVSLIGWSGMYRIIEISGDCTFEDLHRVLFTAFDREEEHLYSFYLTGRDSKSLHSIIRNSEEITCPDSMEDFFIFHGSDKASAADLTLDDIGFGKGFIFHYLFDFGDDWWHRIRVQKVEENQHGSRYMHIAKRVGESPEQYPDFEDDFDDDFFLSDDD